MRTPGQYIALVTHLGPRWLLRRAGHVMRRRAGWLRRASPVARWDELPAPALKLGAVAPAPVPPASWGEACVHEAERIIQGNFRLFSSREVAAGFPPNWHRNHLAAPDLKPLPATRHWSALSDGAGEDIKGVWELSRFSWAFALVRAQARTGDTRYQAAFWRLLQDWADHNPPNVGPNWMCGQEATFRLMAVIFAAEQFGVPEACRAPLSRFVVASARRIAAHLDYALSQDNNHGVSECVGLITAGSLLRDHAPAADWLSRGLDHLEAQLERLVYRDGGFSQHSLVYHRVLLHDLCWARWRLGLMGMTIPVWLDGAARRALAHLMAVTDPSSGQAPLYGANDGANVLPLAEAGFLDMRPVIQMTSALFQQCLPLPPGPWDEAAAWLQPAWQTLPRSAWTTPAIWHATEAGLYQLRRGSDRLVFRCPTRFRHRPAQADMLHVDVWHDGRAIALDGGSFSYNSRERFTALGTGAHHNALTVDAVEPMSKFSRFLYLPWPRGAAGPTGDGAFRASHEGYAALGIAWTREVSIGVSGGFSVRDIVRGGAGHRLRWHWRLADEPWREVGEGAVEFQAEGRGYRVSWSGSVPYPQRLLRADLSSAYGWWSPHYGEVQPAVALIVEIDARGDIEWVTRFNPLR